MCIRDSNEHHNSQFDLAMLHYERALTIYERTLGPINPVVAVSYTHLRAHETVLDLVCRLLLETKQP